jgi:hypothetical protein
MPVDAERRAIREELNRTAAGTERRLDPKPVEVPDQSEGGAPMHRPLGRDRVGRQIDRREPDRHNCQRDKLTPVPDRLRHHLGVRAYCAAVATIRNHLDLQVGRGQRRR